LRIIALSLFVQKPSYIGYTDRKIAIRKVNRPISHPGGNAFVGGSSPPAEVRPLLRPIPMLLFTEAARHNVRMSVLLFVLALMSTHPPTGERIQRLRAMGGIPAGN
jgi:Zn-dependent protease with chaperone function